MPRAMILTALPVEYKAVRAYLTDLQEETHPQGTVYERGKFAANGQIWEVGIAEVGAGNAGSAIEAERGISYFKPDILFFVGIAGGIKDVAIGDVVVATKVYGYESGKVGEQFFTRPALEQSAYMLVQRAKAEARKEDWLKRLSNSPISQPRVFVAPIAAGEKVVASRESDAFNFIRERYNDAIAVEMEGFGFLKAAFDYPQIAAIVIRGISDLVKDKNASDPVEGTEDERQKRASCNASAFAFEVLAKQQAYQSKKIRQWKYYTPLYISLATLALLILRFLGILMPLELIAFDALMNLRFYEEKDDRIHIIEIAEKDLKKQREKYKNGNRSLNDESLINVLNFLGQEERQPRVIGLDIFRPAPENQSSQEELIQILGKTKQLIGICKLPEIDENLDDVVEDSGVKPPAPEQIPSERVGFSDFANDNGIIRRHLVNDNGVIRRHLVFVNPHGSDTDQCSAKESFSLLLAKEYLKPKNFDYERPTALKDSKLFNNSNVVFSPIRRFTGGYQGIKDVDDFQILLNYRSLKNGEAIADRKKLSEFLNTDERKKISTDWTKDKIILIGLTAEDSNLDDYALTPYGDLPGVIIHAHMTSQIIRAVLDERSLLKVFSQKVEAGWIIFWCVVGGALAYFFKKTRYRIVASSIALGIIFILCWVFLATRAIWTPIVPPALGLIICSQVVMCSRHSLIKSLNPRR